MRCEFAMALILHSMCLLALGDVAAPEVRTQRVPNGGIQPQTTVGQDGVVHMLYYQGESSAGDVYYVRSSDAGASFSDPIRVNSQPGSAIAAGTIRGAHLALGRNDRVHVAWNGSGQAKPKGLPNPALPEDSPYRKSSPMLYARMNSEATGFEPQRNLMTSTYALDGGGSIAADRNGNVYVVWHANTTMGRADEQGRAVWVATSRDDGQMFASEIRANKVESGACGCCGLRAATDGMGNVYILYRSALESIHRDMYLLASNDHGRTFSATKLDDWEVSQCVMSSASFLETKHGMWAAWEAEHQVKFGPVYQLLPATIRQFSAPGLDQQTRKHPVLQVNSKGQMILVWTEGTGWQKGGTVAWQVYDSSGEPIPGAAGRRDGVPIWGLVAVLSGENDEFTLVY